MNGAPDRPIDGIVLAERMQRKMARAQRLEIADLTLGSPHVEELLIAKPVKAPPRGRERLPNIRSPVVVGGFQDVRLQQPNVLPQPALIDLLFALIGIGVKEVEDLFSNSVR